MASDPAPGRVRPTSLKLLGATAVGGVLLGWFGGTLLERSQGVAPTVPWTSVFVLVFAAAVLGGSAWSTWRTIHQQRRWIDPHRAVNLLVLAKASSLVGALVAGGYVGFGALFLDDLVAPLPQQRVVRSALVAVAAVLVLVAALLLERACRVPKAPEGEGEDEDDDGDDED